ncbi:hypothetical protein XV93_16900 [Vibrio metoecus]|nr:hypothetical protein XV93_16900 [Vibrio metoecus]
MKPAKQTTASLAFLAMGIVYGDIGTSPLYAFKEVFFSHHRLVINPDSVLGILSLVFWAFVLIVSIKYLLLVTRAPSITCTPVYYSTILDKGRACLSPRVPAQPRFILTENGVGYRLVDK